MQVDTSGLLTFVKISDEVQQGFDYAMFGVREESGYETIFALWWGHFYGGPRATAPDWIIRAAELAMLREALSKKLQVTVTHEYTSNVPTVVKVHSPP